MAKCEEVMQGSRVIGTVRRVAQVPSGLIGSKKGYRMDAGYLAKRGRFDTGQICETKEAAEKWLIDNVRK